MSFDNLPTDNLYKFITLLGIALFALGSWMENDNNNRASRTFFQNKAMLELINEKTELLQKDILFLKGENNEISEEAVRSNIQRTRDMVANHASITKELEKYRSEIFPEYVTESYLFETNFKSVQIAKFLGLFIAALGFASWWFLHQRYQDAIIREQARNAQLGKDAQI